jgi:excisionase family DNA binding protein
MPSQRVTPGAGVNLQDRLRLLRDTLPANGAVTFTRADLSELLGEVDASETVSLAKPADLTVTEIATELKRSPNRIRDYIRNGELKAYTFGRELRCTRAALDAFIEAKRAGKREIAGTQGKAADLGRWRNVRPAA